MQRDGPQINLYRYLLGGRDAVMRSGYPTDPGDAGEGGKRPRQRRDVLVLPDGAGPASETSKVYARNQRLTLRKRRAGSNLVDRGL